MTTYTSDAFFEGRLKVCQPARGYRFSVDAVLLSRWAKLKKGAKVLDIGTGSGVIALILAYLYPSIKVTAVEIQPDLAAVARLNVKDNGFKHMEVVEGDVRALAPIALGAHFDAIVCNPPYFAPHTGKTNINDQERLARHEISLDLPSLIKASRSLLTTKGKLYLIYPAERMGQLAYELKAGGFEMKALRCVHSYKTSPACLVLTEASFRGNPGLKIHKPLYLYTKPNRYTAEVMAMFSDGLITDKA